MSTLEGRDVFQLHPLLYPALPDDPSISSASPAALSRSARCAEPFGSHLYLGSSDGQVHCFIQPEIDDTNGNTSSNELQYIGIRHISSKPIERIVILGKIGIAAVLSEATLTFYELPAFTPIPHQILPHTKSVASIVVDDEEVEDGLKRAEGGVDAEGLCNLCIVKRKSISLVKVGVDTWRTIKEIPLPAGATVARRFGSALCFSTTTDYHMIDLDEATISDIGLPITQTGEPPSASNRPSIVSFASTKAAQCEFIITSHSQASTLGVFVSQKGEPTAKLIEWPSHPRALAMEYPFLHALLRNDSIEVHNILTMQKVQTIQLPESLEPRTLSLATSNLELTEGISDRAKKIRVRLERGGKRQRLENSIKDENEQTKSRSRVLMIGKNVVQHLSMSDPLLAARKAILRGDYERAKSIVELALDIDGAPNRSSEEDDQLDFLIQMIALHCIKMLQFEEAKRYLLRSQIDPRVILHLFPSIFDTLNIDEAEVEMHAEIEETLNELGDMEAFPSNNLHSNYSPPLQLDGDKLLKDLYAKLKHRLYRLLRDMVAHYRDKDALMKDPLMRTIMDNTTARLMVIDEQTKELGLYLHQENHCDLRLLEPDLYKMGCFAALLKVKRIEQDHASVLDLFTRLLDGDLHDETFTGALSELIEMLENCPDENLVHKYSLWLVQRDAEAGIRLLTRDRSSTFRDQKTLLQELRGIDERAADGFLEYMALSRKQHTSEAHMELAQVLLDRVISALRDEDTRSMMSQITQDYIEGGFAESFVAHMALYSHQSPVILLRLKLIMLLQGSSLLDYERVLVRISKDHLLLFEQAVLAGRLSRDEEALELFAIRLRDANSAEIYCNQNRFALSSIQLQSLAQEQKELVLYAKFYSKSVKRATRTDKVKLLKVLLKVYMQRERGEDRQEDGLQIATSHLLNSQSLNLSASEVLDIVPSHWSLSTLETFLSRSLRKEMHRFNEGQIERSIALAQNLEVAETLWSKRRVLGGVIEDGDVDDHDVGQEDEPIEVDLVGEKYHVEKEASDVIF